MTEDEIVEWHQQLNGHEFEQTSGDDEGRGSLACCSPRGCKESEMIERLNNSNKHAEYSLEGLMLKLKLQYFGHLMQRTDSFEKILMLGKFEGRRRRGGQRMRWLDGIIDSMDMSLSKLQEMLKDSKAWHAEVHEVTKSQTGLSNLHFIMEHLSR